MCIRDSDNAVYGLPRLLRLRAKESREPIRLGHDRDGRGAEIELAGLHRLLAGLRNDAAFKRQRLGFGDGGFINFSRVGGFEGWH